MHGYTAVLQALVQCREFAMRSRGGAIKSSNYAILRPCTLPQPHRVADRELLSANLEIVKIIEVSIVLN